MVLKSLRKMTKTTTKSVNSYKLEHSSDTHVPTYIHTHTHAHTCIAPDLWRLLCLLLGLHTQEDADAPCSCLKHTNHRSVWTSSLNHKTWGTIAYFSPHSSGHYQWVVRMVVCGVQPCLRFLTISQKVFDQPTRQKIKTRLELKNRTPHDCHFSVSDDTSRVFSTLFCSFV